MLHDRLKVIAAMNHHVRNALDPILLSSSLQQQQSAEIVKDATTHITWALEAILGKKPTEE